MALKQRARETKTHMSSFVHCLIVSIDEFLSSSTCLFHASFKILQEKFHKGKSYTKYAAEVLDLYSSL